MRGLGDKSPAGRGQGWGGPAERMWLKLRVKERRDFTQGKTIRTEKKRER